MGVLGRDLKALQRVAEPSAVRGLKRKLERSERVDVIQLERSERVDVIQLERSERV